MDDDTLLNGGPQGSSGEASVVLLDFSQKLSLVDDGEDVRPQRIVVDDGEDVRPQRTVSETCNLLDTNDEQRLVSPNIEIASEKSTVAAPNEGEEQMKFTCSCGERFDKSVQLASHRRWSCRLKEKTAQCEVCNNWFASDAGLRRHMKHAHGGIVSCDSCNLRFPNKIKLTHHWMEAHHDDSVEESKSLKCYVCGDTNFDSKFELECHLVVHKYEKHQEKLSQHGHWPHQTPCSPYPPPCLRRTLRQHLRPRWPFFPFHRPPFPFHHPPHFPFLHHIPFSPPGAASSAPRMERANPPGLSTADESVFTSVHGTPPQPPRHDHTYIEPTDTPAFFPPHLFKHHQHHRSHGKIKWKKYLKLMKKGIVPPLQMDPQYTKLSDVDECQSSNTSKNVDADKCEFKIACKFCDKVIQRNKVNWHQRRECPVLSVHRCSVCDRVFRKRHFLIRHMHEQNHYNVNGQTANSLATSSDAVSSSLSVLQDKMNTSLQLLNVSATPAMRVEADDELAAKTESDSCALKSDEECRESGVDRPMTKDIGRVDYMKSDVECRESGVQPPMTKAIERVQCSICRLYYHSRNQLFEHLKDHINQVLTIQKVQEWTLKSSDYFFLTDADDDHDRETVTSATTSTSCLDSEITSTTDATVNFSSLDSTISADPKWSKPHRKRSGHRHKGDVLICEFCSEQFGFRKDLHFHMETKHKDSTLKCPVCKKKFSWKKRGKFYERHLNSHYGVKVFKHKCETCGKTFLENSKLRAHMSLHNTELLHRCAVCKKGYANKSSLVRHERKHTGVKPYQCQVCSESFMEKRELLRHSTTHTGVAPFSCSECGQGFTLKTSYMSHMKKKHFKP